MHNRRAIPQRAEWNAAATERSAEWSPVSLRSVTGSVHPQRKFCTCFNAGKPPSLSASHTTQEGASRVEASDSSYALLAVLGNRARPVRLLQVLVIQPRRLVRVLAVLALQSSGELGHSERSA